LPYLEQTKSWPRAGKHILAQYDDESIVVYQAYHPVIGEFAAKYQYFGGEFNYTRWSWIKTNFLWVMYRSGWGTKQGQETILRVTLKKDFFDALLTEAVESSRNGHLYATEKAWKTALARSNVRLQWDPDHGPTGGKLQRRAIQLGLRGRALEEYGKEAIIKIDNISEFVTQQRPYITKEERHQLQTPVENVYCPTSEAAERNIGLSECPIDTDYRNRL